MKTKQLTLYSLLIALVALSTMVISIPIGSSGYVNVGDSIIIVISLIYGTRCGMLCGGIGSLLADILLGYGYFAPFTLIVKGIEGYIIALFYKKYHNALLSSVVGVSWMIIGYFISSCIIEHVTIAISGVAFNATQAFICVILGNLVFNILKGRKFIF